MSLFSLPLMLNAQSVDEMLQKVSAAIEAGQQGQAMSYFRQTISLNIDRTEMYYWTNIDKSSEISVKLANELAIAFRKKRNYDKAYLFYKELLQKAPNNVAYLESCAEMQVCRGQEKDALRMYETILQLDAEPIIRKFLPLQRCSTHDTAMDYRNYLLRDMKRQEILCRRLF